MKGGKKEGTHQWRQSASASAASAATKRTKLYGIIHLIFSNVWMYVVALVSTLIQIHMLCNIDKQTEMNANKNRTLNQRCRTNMWRDERKKKQQITSRENKYTTSEMKKKQRTKQIGKQKSHDMEKNERYTFIVCSVLAPRQAITCFVFERRFAAAVYKRSKFCDTLRKQFLHSAAVCCKSRPLYGCRWTQVTCL